ncbi:amidohydrolase family protein [Portibacter lacus]|uniref:Amidohydrolase-related domain-containing protein n=1 Tax=Portibacter lacus TaxID=1099794 RepID=A0AA37WBC9_9BACT|nr:amidohydrolase family protein [Portibacter lacus]GLR15506.1 hypothetical protein GCM10007940_01210 [Portibacter lacus]
MLRKPDQTISRQEFLNTSRRIPSLIRDRIGEPLRSHVYDDTNLLKKDHAFFDVHAHSFSIDHIPSGFIKLLNWVSNQDKVNLLALLNKNFSKYLNLHDPNKVIDNLINAYDKSFADDNIQPKLFIVNLAMDMERGISGAPVFNYKTQLEQLLQMLKGSSPFMPTGRQFSYEKTILPFLAIDPNNPDAYEYFLSAFIKNYNTTGIQELDDKAPFLGVKLYPSLGYSPLDPILLDIYKVCEEKSIPITTHCGGLRTRTSHKKIEIGKRKILNGQVVDSKHEVEVYSKDRAKAIFLDPLHWEKVAIQFPKLKLNLAHFGDNEEWKKFHKNPKDPKTFVFKTMKMIEKHENVYGDISYCYYDEANRIKIAAMMQMPKYQHRILYGSDFYLTEVEKFRTKDLFNKFKENFKLIPEKYQLMTSTNPYNFIFGEP